MKFKNMFKQGKKKAFTLAEVLITLVVIGVVAALTIPVLNNSQSDKALKSAAKKNAAAIQQALDLYYANNSASFIETSTDNMEANLDKFLSYLRADVLPGDDGIIDAIIDSKYKNMEGNAITEDDILPIYPATSYRLADGTDLYLTLASDDGVDGILGVTMDVNGINKGPNTLGKDLIILAYVGKTNKIFFDSLFIASEPWKTMYEIIYN